MERITFFERYRISTDDAGNPREIGRSGAAVSYRAVDLQSGEPVALKIIPMASVEVDAREQLQERARATQHLEHENVTRLLAFIVDKDDYVFVSELTHGDTLAQWVATHGPLAPDATLRVALQVVSGLQAAAFHGLTHAAIEPSNIVIVPGVASDGGWPAIKLLNLDSAGVPIVSPEQHSPLVGTAAAPQFAAPEQLHSGIADFRSEIYSLGATMCFMLTGLAPLSVMSHGQKGEAKLPANLRRLPRNVRELLLDMLRPNPEDRPQDPVAFAERIRLVLGMLERRRPSRSAVQAAPVAPVMPFQYRRPPSFIRPIAIAAGIVAIGAIATLLIAQPIRAIWRRHNDVTQIGVPVGVPDAQASPAGIVQSAPPSAAATAPQIAASNVQTQEQQQAAEPAATVAAESQTNDTNVAGAAAAAPAAQTEGERGRVAQNDGANDAAPLAAAPAATAQAENTRVAENQTAETAAPAEGPATQPAPAPSAPADTSDARVASTTSSSNQEQAQPAQEPQPARAGRTTKKVAANSTRRQSTGEREQTSSAPAPRDTQTARFVGTTHNGEWIFEAPSGNAILDLPGDDQDRRNSRRRRHRRDETRPQATATEPVEPEVRRALPPDQDE
jgi:hypothetical protein